MDTVQKIGSIKLTESRNNYKINVHYDKSNFL
jgi:hypothetical protein